MLIKKVKETINKYGMLKEGDRVLIGVSGGPDSVTLLHLLNSIRKEMNLWLHIVHLDHGFRGDKSKEDRIFVEDLARSYNITITTEEINVPDIVKVNKKSPEETAREERYNFFMKVAQVQKIDKIAVGHTRDDQAETVLMRIIRGCGLLGLCGISPVVKIGQYSIIRPLIEIWRKDIEEFISKNNINVRRDSSNMEPIYFRNRIRLNLLPLLEREYNPNIREILVNMAENLRIDNDYLDRMGKRKFKSSFKRGKNNEIIIDLKKFSGFHEAIQKMILRLAVKEIKGDLKRITYQHWKEVYDLIRNRTSGDVVNLPKDISVLKSRGKLIFYLGKPR